MCIYIYIYITVNLYTYTYTYKHIRTKCYTPDLTKMKLHWKGSLKVHSKIPVQIHWTSDNPLEHTTDK